MKPLPSFFLGKKMLLVGAVLLCAVESSSARSILNHDSQDILRSEIFGSNDAFQGALTFENAYRFDFANAGIGTVVFRPSSRQFRSLVLDQDAPRAVSGWGRNAEPSSFVSASFASTPSFFSHPSFDYSLLDDPSSPDLGFPVPAVPEPSTWLAGALALAAMGFARRQSLARLISRRA